MPNDNIILIIQLDYIYTFIHVSTLYVAVNVSFQLQNYNVNESDGKVEPVLVLSNPSAVNITVEVFSTDGSATGKQ